MTTANNHISEILLKRSSVPGAAPTSLLPGEPAVNLYDGKMFIQLVNGKVVNIASSPIGNTYYVSSEGSDSEDGLTPSRALKTIRRASMLAKPGDSIDVSSGHYFEVCPIIIAQNVQIQGAGERNCLIEPTDPTKDVFWVNNNSYVTGFKFVNHLGSAIAFPDEIESGTANGVTSNTITLPSTSEVVDDYYIGMQVTVTSGNGASLIYNKDLCSRDIGYIIDSICFDLLYGGNRQSFQSGVYYYGFNEGSDTIVQNEIKEVNAAYDYLREVVGKVILGETVTSYQNVVPQITGTSSTTSEVSFIDGEFTYITDILTSDISSITDTIIPNGFVASSNANVINAFNLLQSNKDYLKTEAITWVEKNKSNYTFNSGTTSEVATITTDFDYITGILDGGVSGVTDTIIPNGLVASSNTNVINAYNRLQENKDYLKAEAVAWVEANKPTITTYTYNRATCARDVGYIVDSVCFDLLYGGNRQAMQSAVYYYGFNSSSTTVIPNEIPEVINAYNHLKTIAGQIILGQTVTAYQNVVTQNTSVSFGTSSEVSTVQNNVDLIINIISNGPSVANTKTPIPLSSSSNNNVINASTILHANREFIAQELIAYTGHTYPSYSYDHNLCLRDTRLIVDSLVQDLLFQTDSQSNFTGLQYWSKYGYTGNIQNELTLTIGAIEYIRDLSAKIILNDTTGTRYQSIIQQQVGKLSYSQDFCARDVGYIVDSICFDLLYGGNRQAFQSGIYYYGFDEGSSTVVDGQLPKVLDAYDHLKLIAGQVILGQTVTTYQNIVTQNTSLSFGTSSEVNTIQSSIDTIINIISSGPSVANTKKPIPLTASSNTNISNTVNILEANREFLAKELTGYIHSTYEHFNFDTAKCERDTGLIVDAVAQDLLFQTDSQSTFAGLQYWSKDGYTGKIASELQITVDAMNYIKGIAKKVVVNDTSGIRAQGIISQNTSISFGTDSEVQYTQNSVNTIINIINHGPAAANTKTPINLTMSSNTNIANAVNILEANREFIQTEISLFVEETFANNSTTGYDQDKCLRDTKLIIDSVAFDILYNGSTQSQFAGLQYWVNTKEPAKIPNEVTQTVLAINEIKTVILSFISSQSTLSKNTVSNLLDYLANILSNGVSTVTDSIISNDYPSIVTDILNTYSIIQTNKLPIQNQVAAWIDDQILNASPTSPWYLFTYNKDYCYRDIGFIVDCVCFDLKHGGNRQTTQAGVYYYNYQENLSQIATEKTESIAAFNYLKSLISDVVVGNPVSTLYQNAYSQVITTQIATSTQSNTAVSRVNTITNIIENGPIEISRVPISLTQSSDNNDYRAFDLILKNKNFLAAEVVAYTNSVLIGPFIFDEDKKSRCFRDVGLIVDAVAQDLLFQTDSQSNFTGLQYWSKNSYTGKIPAQLDITVGALDYVKSLTEKIILNDGTGTRYQDLQQQHIGNLVYDKEYCSRDVGYIVDSVIFDLLYGGNRQAYQSGMYYYNYDGTSTAIPNESAEVIDAFNHLKTIAGQIILGETVDNYQNAVTQNTSGSFGSASEVTVVQNDIDNVINIITNGPSVVQLKRPIGLTQNTNPDVANAAFILNANREFMAKELNAYIANTYPLYSYDTVVCERDTGLIVDAITQDLLFDSTSQSNFAGIQYWNKNGYTGKIKSELTITVDAINYIKSLAGKVIVNDASGTRYQSDVAQVFGTAATTSEIASVNTEFTYITDILTTDLSGITDTIVPNSIIPSSNTNMIHACNLLLNNKKYLQAEAIAWVEANKSSYTFNSGTTSEISTVFGEFDYITEILKFGATGIADTGLTNSIIPNGFVASSNTNVINTYNLLQDNREYLKAEAVAWVESNKFMNQANVLSYSASTKTITVDRDWPILPDNNCGYSIRIPLRGAAASLSERYTTFITGSPYIYNCSSISPGGTGITVDGNLSMGNKSIVSAQFTQFNSGGRGIYIKNDGYAQLVGIYALFCDRAFTAENGGTASLGNCNVNFGNYGLTSIGKGGLAMTAKLKGDSVLASKTMKIYNVKSNAALSIRAKMPYSGMIMKIQNDPNPANYYIVESATVDQYGIITVTFAIKFDNIFLDNTNVYFYQQSQLRASGQTYEFVGAGTEMQQVLPKYGGIPQKDRQTSMIGEGVVYATATDQDGNFIVSELNINQATSSIVGRTFEKSLFAQITPYILAIQ